MARADRLCRGGIQARQKAADGEPQRQQWWLRKYEAAPQLEETEPAETRMEGTETEAAQTEMAAEDIHGGSLESPQEEQPESLEILSSEASRGSENLPSPADEETGELPQNEITM